MILKYWNILEDIKHIDMNIAYFKKKFIILSKI